MGLRGLIESHILVELRRVKELRQEGDLSAALSALKDLSELCDVEEETRDIKSRIQAIKTESDSFGGY